jgi:nicotinamidase/pyrazinamidase
MKTVFFDIDSQLDFLYAAGALYVPDAERILPAIARLNRFAAAHGIPVVSTTDAHAENDPEFSVWPPHCIAGTWGQRKAEPTLLDRTSQIIVEKQTVDVFQAPNLARVLECLNADRYVVYGVVTEICVLYAVRGLLRTGKPVTLVTDAVRALAAEASARALEEVRAGGGTLATVGEIVLGS